MNYDQNIQVVEQHFPQIAKALKLLWGYPQAAIYVTKLLADTRDNTRQGFSPKVLTALLSIQEKHAGLVKEDFQASAWGESPPSQWGDSREFFR